MKHHRFNPDKEVRLDKLAQTKPDVHEVSQKCNQVVPTLGSVHVSFEPFVERYLIYVSLALILSNTL